MAEQKPTLRVVWLSGGLAILVTFFLLAIELPNNDRAVIDNSSVPPRLYLQPQPILLCELMAVFFIPALSIFLFGKRWFIVEILGWLILGFLLATLP
jgi:hypothetical protein